MQKVPFNTYGTKKIPFWLLFVEFFFFVCLSWDEGSFVLKLGMVVGNLMGELRKFNFEVFRIDFKL